MGLLNLIIESCIEPNENPFKIPIFRFCSKKIGGYFFCSPPKYVVHNNSFHKFHVSPKPSFKTWTADVYVAQYFGKISAGLVSESMWIVRHI